MTFDRFFDKGNCAISCAAGASFLGGSFGIEGAIIGLILGGIFGIWNG